MKLIPSMNSNAYLGKVTWAFLFSLFQAGQSEYQMQLVTGRGTLFRICRWLEKQKDLLSYY